MAVIKAVSSKAGIGQALDYVTKEEKTEEKLVSGLHCDPETVKDEMQAQRNYGERQGAGRISISYKVIMQTNGSRRSKLTGMRWSLQKIHRHGKALRF